MATRPGYFDLESGTQGWDADQQTNLERIFDNPFQVPRFANLAAFPSAAIWDQSEAIAQDTGIRYISQNDAWVVASYAESVTISALTGAVSVTLTAGLTQTADITGNITSLAFDLDAEGTAYLFTTQTGGTWTVADPTVGKKIDLTDKASTEVLWTIRKIGTTIIYDCVAVVAV